MAMRGDARRPRVLLGLLFVSAAMMARLAVGADSSLDALLAQYRAQPNNALLCEQIGVAYAQSGDFNRAAEFFRKVVQLNPERIPARKNLATVLWFAGRKSESENIFGQLEKLIPDDPVPQLYLGLGAYEHKNFEQAAVHLERAGTLASRNPEVVPVLIETYLSTGRFQKAREEIKLQLKEKPSSAQLLLELGLSYALQGDFQGGKQAFLEASVADPRWSLPFLALGITDLQTGGAASASEYFQKAELRGPGDYRCYYLRAIALKHSQAGGDAATRAEELKDLKRAAALEPNQASTWVALAETEMSASHNAEAETDLRKALHLQPDEPTALYKLASLCRREGKTQESELLLAALKESKRKKQTGEIEFMSLLRTVNSNK